MAKRAKRRDSNLAVVVQENGEISDQRAALAVQDRKLSFGDKWAYSPAPESNSYIKLQTRYPLFINGKFVAPRSGKYFDSINPATEEKLAEIAEGNSADVDRAVQAARRASQTSW